MKVEFNFDNFEDDSTLLDEEIKAPQAEIETLRLRVEDEKTHTQANKKSKIKIVWEIIHLIKDLIT